MSSNRLDGWTPEEEQMLAEIVLRTIRTGGTQLLAFQNAAQIVKRTPTACGHRWNRVVREKFRDEIENAKRENITIHQMHNYLTEENSNSENIVDKNDVELNDILKFKANVQELHELLKVKILSEERLCKEMSLLRKWVDSRKNSSTFVKIISSYLRLSKMGLDTFDKSSSP